MGERVPTRGAEFTAFLLVCLAFGSQTSRGLLIVANAIPLLVLPAAASASGSGHVL